jgi:hypothetical protein
VTLYWAEAGTGEKDRGRRSGAECRKNRWPGTNTGNEEGRGTGVGGLLTIWVRNPPKATW